MQPAKFTLPTVPGRYWVSGTYRDETGKALRFAHAMVDAPTALHAAQLPVIDSMVERLAEGMSEAAGHRVEINVKPMLGKAVANG